MKICVNCGDEVYTPDVLTGEIHKHGKYACFTDKGKRLDTVAEGMEFETDPLEFEDHSGHDHAEFNYGTVCLI